jgi:hypothetical protein
LMVFSTINHPYHPFIDGDWFEFLFSWFFFSKGSFTNFQSFQIKTSPSFHAPRTRTRFKVMRSSSPLAKAWWCMVWRCRCVSFLNVCAVCL